MKVLITGARGQLGTELMKVLIDKDVFALGRDEMDITNQIQVRMRMEEISPDVVIHCAAYSEVDECEYNIDFANKVNAVGTGYVAVECLKIGAAMVYVSTDYVFDGQKGQPYYEFDKPNPKSTYGKTKLAGEEIVRRTLRQHYIIRTAWLYGREGNNFVKTMLKLASIQKVINVVDDQIGSPTNARDLAEAIRLLIESNKYGIYHVTNSGSCSWYDFAKKIFEVKGINVQVNPITTEQLNRPAPRPAHSVLNNFNLQERLNYVMRHWEEALEEYLTTSH